MAKYYELLVEEASAEAFLLKLIPKLIAEDDEFRIHSYNGKHDLLRKLPNRLKGYAGWVGGNHKIIVLIDRDAADCRELKFKLEQIIISANLRTKSSSPQNWNAASRIAIEELEAWFFGDWQAVISVYPRAPKGIPANQKYRDVDQISGGTWEALERILQRGGYHRSGLRKVELADSLGTYFDPDRCVSPSFAKFRELFS